MRIDGYSDAVVVGPIYGRVVFCGKMSEPIVSHKRRLRPLDIKIADSCSISVLDSALAYLSMSQPTHWPRRAWMLQWLRTRRSTFHPHTSVMSSVSGPKSPWGEAGKVWRVADRANCLQPGQTGPGLDICLAAPDLRSVYWPAIALWMGTCRECTSEMTRIAIFAAR